MSFDDILYWLTGFFITGLFLVMMKKPEKFHKLSGLSLKISTFVILAGTLYAMGREVTLIMGVSLIDDKNIDTIREATNEYFPSQATTFICGGGSMILTLVFDWVADKLSED